MGTTVHLHIQCMTSKPELFTKWNPTLTSICFILKQSGVLITKNTTKPFVNMLTTGKTSEGNLIYSPMTPPNCVLTGNQKPLLVSMKKVVSSKVPVLSVMVGKS